MSRMAGALHRACDGVAFEVYGTAKPAGSKTAGIAKTGRVFVRDASAGARDWKRNIAAVAAKAMAGRELLEGPLGLNLTFWQPRPTGHYGSKGLRPTAPVYPTVRPDLLKLARAVEDALTGIVYRDDALIVAELLAKEYGTPARVAVQVFVLGR